MYYFRFDIPRHKDGTIARYSKGWHGTMPKCPQNVTVDVYNDKVGFGIAHTDDTFVPPEVQVIPTSTALAQIASFTYVKGEIYVGQEIAKRWAGKETRIG